LILGDASDFDGQFGNNPFGRQNVLFSPTDVWALVLTRSYQKKSFGAPQEAIKTALLLKWTAKAMWKPFGTVGCSAVPMETPNLTASWCRLAPPIAYAS
jgi:hypothetical protein